MARKLPATDVVIIGLGWTGSILAHELCQEGLRVVAIERGPWRDTATDFNEGYIADELRYGVRLELFQRPAQDTVTFRNNLRQRALPIRWFGAFLPGNGVGGAGVHWNGQTWRWLESDFKLRTGLTQRYGASAIPDDMTIQDLPMSYAELEPSYDKFERIAGISGQAGNINGVKQPGGNPFEGPRTRGFPLPPLKTSYAGHLFADAAQSLGHSPFPCPAANASEAYTNPLGVTMGPCTYCGFCERFGCANYSKGSPQTTILPALIRQPNFEARTQCEVLRINKDSTGKRATGVTYVDSSGEEIEQPAEMVLVCAFILNNVRLLLLSGIGQPYDPATGEGVIGRNYAYQSFGSSTLFFEGKRFNNFMGAGALQTNIDDWNGDNFDHTGLGFVGGGNISCATANARPIGTTAAQPPGAPKWGKGWKQSVKESYNNLTGVGAQGCSYSYRDAYLDLDPTYKDNLGRPLMRMTFDWHDNERKMTKFLAQKCAELGRAMGAKQVLPHSLQGSMSVVPYQTTHNTGGAITGADPKTSAVNRYMQSWDVSNVFVLGASAFPQNVGYNPTGTVGGMAYWAAEAIRTQYLKSPGPLVQA